MEPIHLSRSFRVSTYRNVKKRTMKPINAEFAQYVEGAREAQCPAPLILHPAFDVHMNQIAGMPAVTEYSTGIHAIPLAAAMCDDITVYGFGGPTVRETE
jgi:hypothetical protein